MRVCFYCFTLHVLIPNGAYSGQKLTKLVSKNTAPSINSTKPKVPEMVPVK